MALNQRLLRICSATLLLTTVACRENAVFAGGADANRWDFGRYVIPRIPPGTVVGKDNPNGWNRLVLLATPRLAAGAVSKIPRMARDYATRFKVVIMARVRTGKTTSGRDGAANRYRLTQVGVGCCAEIAGEDVVISSATQEKLGANLNAIEQIVLKQNEKPLNDMVQIVRSSTHTVFDVEAIVLHDGKHQDMLIRHMVWANPATGKTASLVWPLTEDPQGLYVFAGKSLFALPGGFREDRIIHVSADEITFGIPSARAFAIESMPPGKEIPFNAEIAQLAAQKEYTRASILKLLQAVKKAL